MDRLSAALDRLTRAGGGGDALYATPMPGVSIMRCSREMLPFRRVYRPSLCVVAQGAKEIVIGDRVLDYAAGMALVVSVELPGAGRVTEASREVPYLGMTIELDVGLMHEVMTSLEAPPAPTGGSGLGVFVERLSEPLQDCIARLVRLAATPDAVAVLYPAIMREICFWLLTGPNGGEVCKLSRTESHTRRIADAIFLLRQNFARPIRVEEMAEAARMGPSSFHQHFKTVTSMTPLQYQKQLRLLEARRLMVTERTDVTRAAFEVGYESASQFSREYARMFGTPPKRHAESLRALAVPLDG